MSILSEVVSNTFILLNYCFIVALSYPILNSIFYRSKLYNELSYAKKAYVVKNISKSIFLCYITLDLAKLILTILYYNKDLDNESVKQVASFYVSNDIVALLLVPNISKTTKRHHYTTTFLLFVNYCIDYSRLDLLSSKIGLLLIGYTTLSAFSFPVNLFLGSRFIIQNNQYKYLLNKIAYYNYKLSLALNWATQLIYILYSSWLNYNHILTFIVYTCIMLPIINDDIILISWLQKNLKTHKLGQIGSNSAKKY